VDPADRSKGRVRLTWLLAAVVVLSGWMLGAAATSRADRVVLTALGLRDDPRPRISIGSVSPRVVGGIGVAVGAVAATVDPITGLIAAPILGVAGARLPRFVSARSETSRRAEVAADVPDLLDVAAVSVTAGLSPRLSLDRATDAIRGPLRGELSAIRHDVALGGTWPEGLRRAAEHVRAPELRRLATVLEESQRLGAPVAERLRDVAGEVRAERRARREERARRAPVAMLFPLVLLILPAFVLAAVLPAVLVAVRGVI
jgi:tight adherence protein C